MKIMKTAIIATTVTLLLTSCSHSDPVEEISSNKDEEISTALPLNEDLNLSSEVWNVEKLSDIVVSETAEVSVGEHAGIPTVHVSDEKCFVSADMSMDEELTGFVAGSLYDTQVEAYSHLGETRSIEEQFISEVAADDDSKIALFSIRYLDAETGETGFASVRSFLTAEGNYTAATLSYGCSDDSSLDDELFEKMLESVTFLKEG